MTTSGPVADPAGEHDAEAAHLLALAALPGIGPAAVLACHRGRGAVAAWRALVTGRPDRHPDLAAAVGRLHRRRHGERLEADLVAAARAADPAETLARHLAHGCRILVHGRADYPRRLADDPAPPAVLLALGDLSALDGPTVAVVGTRNATRLGRDLAAGLGRDLAGAGVAVVSGLALGIDAAAHRGALAAAHAEDREAVGTETAAPAPGIGPPVGVVASGPDIAYPRSNRRLHHDVRTHGLLLTETPLGLRPTAWRFPARNRVIAALADAVVVVESRRAGGSILTAGEALERGVTVLAVPGHPTAPAAGGTNDLLFDGAAVVRSSTDVLDAIGLTVPAPPSRSTKPTAPVDPLAAAILAAIGETPAALGEIVARSGLDLDAVSPVLAALEAQGLVSRTGGWYERGAGPAPAGTGRGTP
jgi:DNA processing protein